MVLAFLGLLVSAGLTFILRPWWGVPASMRDGLGVLIGTLMVGSGLILVDSRGVFYVYCLVAILAVVSLIDMRWKIIPNRLVAITALWAIAVRLQGGDWVTSVVFAGVVFLFYLMIHVVTGAGLGMGDVKFSSVMALGLGYPAGLVALVVGLWAAGVYAAALYLTRRSQAHSMMALGPFLALGGLIGVLDLLH